MGYAFDARRQVQQRKAYKRVKRIQRVPRARQHRRPRGRGRHRHRVHRPGHQFTDAIIQPLINRIGAGKEASYGILQISIGGGQTIDLNVLLSAFINFVLVAAVVYFLVVLPYNRIRSKETAEAAGDKQIRLLTEIRDAVGGKDTSKPVERAKNFTLSE